VKAESFNDMEEEGVKDEATGLKECFEENQ
jgi:hypothetical protein